MSQCVGLGMAKHICEGCVASLPALTSSILCSRVDKKKEHFLFLYFFPFF